MILLDAHSFCCDKIILQMDTRRRIISRGPRCASNYLVGGFWRVCIFSLCLLASLPAHAEAQVIENFECLSNGCCNHHELCRFWDSFGECDNNRSWMRRNCQISCNSCQPNSRFNNARTMKTKRPIPLKKQELEIENDAIVPIVKTRPLPLQFSQLMLERQMMQQHNTQQAQNFDPQISQRSTQSFQQPTQQQQQDLSVRMQQDQFDFRKDTPNLPLQRPSLQQQQLLIQQQETLFPRQFQGNNLVRCEEIRRSSFNMTIKVMQNEGLLADREDVSFRRIVSLDDIMGSNRQFGCAPQQEFVDCSRNMCYHLRYRTMDGTCNNFQNALFGAAATSFMRLKSARYDDAIGAPTGSIHGGRPPARQASRFVLRSNELVTNPQFSMLLMQFGQFVTHDVTKTSILPQDQCPPCADIPGRCTPIRLEQGDFHSGCQQQPCCLTFSRSSPVCGSGANSLRVQLNENTAFIDGSMVYGSSVADNNRLRDGPFMRMTQFNGRNFLPFNVEQCLDPFTCNANFQAGDDRVTIFVGLTAFHTVMLREHNRLVSVLRQRNQQWNDERVFQEARKIVGAELQAITFKEWLPKILGSAFNNIIGPYQGYNPQTNPSIASEFTHGAMRFGHGMIPEFFNRVDANGQTMGRMRFDEGVLKPQKLLFEGGIDPILRGMMTMPVKKPQRVSTVITERMFGNNDLAAINLQRGRDAGIPSYNEMREFCGLRKAQNFDELSGEILDSGVRANLQKGFPSPDNVDLYVGVLMEDPIADGLVGSTLSCLIGDQFRRIRDGDRFWYQSPAAFTPEQIEQLERVTLARLLCDNGDGIQTIPKDAFHVNSGGNAVPCSSIPSMDLSPWSE